MARGKGTSLIDQEARVRIRRAREAEAELLTDLALRSKAVWGYSEAFLERCRPVLSVDAEYLRAHPVFVAEMEGELAGFASLRERGPDVELDLLFVEPRLLRRGIGQALLEHALRAAAASGYARMVVESDPYAEAFYLRSGGRRIGAVASTVEEGRELPLLAYELPNGTESP